MVSKSILIVEDDPDLRNVLLMVLSTRGYETEATGSFQQGLELAERFAPDLIISDIHLEEGDGRELLKQLKSRKGTRESQFVFMTADVEGTSQRAGMNLGADDYLAKPFSVDAFIECVEARFSKRESSRLAEQRLMQMMRDSVYLTVPHEFLTPLNGIIGLSEYLMEAREDTSPEAVRELATDINECGARLLRTVRNYLAILDVMEHPAAMAGSSEVVDSATVNERLSKLSNTVAAKFKRVEDLSLDRLLPDSLELQLNLDRFEAVLQEVLENAFKFSSNGNRVRIAMAKAEDTLLLSIEDHGCGMTRNQARQIGAFQQFDRKRYAQQGLGLGLTLAQQLLHRDGGGLRIESEVGRGTLVVAHWAQEYDKS